jgi:hypothetical protein
VVSAASSAFVVRASAVLPKLTRLFVARSVRHLTMTLVGVPVCK